MTAVVNQVLATGALALLGAAVPVALARPAWILRYRVQLSSGMASLATAGSLYYSEVAGFIPCELCWWQRIFMYPLVVVLGVAWMRGMVVRLIVVVQAALGLAVSVYHYTLQQYPQLAGDACSLDAPCSAAWVWEYGFVSIPFMAGVAFFVLLVLNFPKEST